MSAASSNVSRHSIVSDYACNRTTPSAPVPACSRRARCPGRLVGVESASGHRRWRYRTTPAEASRLAMGERQIEAHVHLPVAREGAWIHLDHRLCHKRSRWEKRPEQRPALLSDRAPEHPRATRAGLRPGHTPGEEKMNGSTCATWAARAAVRAPSPPMPGESSSRPSPEAIWRSATHNTIVHRHDGHNVAEAYDLAGIFSDSSGEWRRMEKKAILVPVGVRRFRGLAASHHDTRT